MSARITQGKGKLYKAGDKQAITAVNYQLHEELTPGGGLERWWGELTFTESIKFSNSDRYVIELEDKRKSQCHLKKRVNRAVSGLPPRWIYHVTGNSPIE